MFGPSTIIFEKHRTMIFYKGYAFSEVVEYNYFIHSQDLADGPFHFILSYAIATLCTRVRLIVQSNILHSLFLFVRARRKVPIESTLASCTASQQW
jgi:hypothetical protein